MQSMQGLNPLKLHFQEEEIYFILKLSISKSISLALVNVKQIIKNYELTVERNNIM